MTAHPAVAAVAALTGRAAASARPLGGHLFVVELVEGGALVAKRHSDPRAVLAEVTSLEWLAAASAVRVPAVLGSDQNWMIMERVDDGRPSAGAAEALGRGLARLHRAGAPAFGAPPPGGPVDAYIGNAAMRNEPGADWPSWYAAHRVEPYLRRAVDGGLLDAAGARAIGTVCERITELAGPVEPPARLHGDLWSGNVLWAGEAWLIDPAAHGGHRETDLAMLQLFGCPHLDRVLGAYHETAPLAAGWRARVPLHQLFPLLVHVVLFGGGYPAQAVAAARAALALS
ncbi:MAG TPA: fructosamine kinase family protein [Actinophytocola sp.]|uniref:fructosamine kinase family protein n=1 Tax=Actinophytocola sp. TaxID=1872138 RepID=UPI002DDC980B|nr:fructosamine kinase family protein [Actinophytocola sp.]HEV2779386.1 fructosamine kinase family protein [Actinophytocola sp.]